MTDPVVGRVFQKVLVPLVAGCDDAASLRTAGAVAKGRSVVLVGIVPVAPEDSLSKGALPARTLRKTLQRARRSGLSSARWKRSMFQKIHGRS